MKKELRGSILLLLATVIWGSAFVFQSMGMDHIGPFAFQAVRCLIATLGLLPIIYLFDRKKSDNKTFLSRWRDKTLWKAGALCAIPLFLAVNFQQVGLVDTDAGKAGFLTAMYIVLVPVLGVFLGQKLRKNIPISVLLGCLGLYFLSWAGSGSFHLSDLLLLGCALAFAFQIQLVDKYAGRVDPLRLNCLQAFLCGVFTVPFAIFEGGSLRGIADCAVPLIYTGFLSMGIAYSLQIFGQKYLKPAPAALIMSLESVFALLFGWLLLGETLSANESIGCVLVFGAVIISQLPEKRKVYS